MLRIISGTYRGRRLKAPQGLTVRPTPARVREAMFSVLGPLDDSHNVLDLFAGSGALGLESLSRGASFCVFVEKTTPTARILADNLSSVGTTSFELLKMSAQRAITLLARHQRKFDLIFVDPPFALTLQEATLSSLITHQLISPGGRVVLEFPKGQTLQAIPAQFQRQADKQFGDVCFQVLRYIPEEPT